MRAGSRFVKAAASRRTPLARDRLGRPALAYLGQAVGKLCPGQASRSPVVQRRADGIRAVEAAQRKVDQAGKVIGRKTDLSAADGTKAPLGPRGGYVVHELTLEKSHLVLPEHRPGHG